jgi:hypothetical protein
MIKQKKKNMCGWVAHVFDQPVAVVSSRSVGRQVENGGHGQKPMAPIGRPRVTVGDAFEWKNR